MTVKRSAVVESLRAEGHEVTERTMRYWESRDWLPRSVRGTGGFATYIQSPINTARLLAATRPKRIAKLRTQTIVHHYPDKTVTIETSGDDIFVRINTRKEHFNA